ncbi:MAG: hypothetical protein COA49_01275 [Bacteroidetes bacterium]|nr:MAG: hypothetical protein COA49_01275 [Bacteroidota bacterium]
MKELNYKTATSYSRIMIEFLISAILITHALIVSRWWRDFNRLEKTNTDSSKIEPLSVIIACKNEAINLPILLEHLMVQKILPEEIIIVDDNSTDKTLDIARSYSLNFIKTKITVISNSGTGKKAAIRSGVERAKTDWIITTDADVKVPSKWILSMGKVIAERQRLYEGVGAIIGPVKIEGDGVESIEYAAMMGWAAASTIKGRAVMASAANLALRVKFYPSKEQMRTEINSGDDVFAVHALVHSGKLVFWAHDIEACVTANKAGGIIKWIHQRSRWGAKAKYYTLKSAKRTSIWIAFLGITELILLIAAITGGITIALLIILWAGRALIDIIFTSRVTKWFGIHSTIWNWVLLSFIYPFQIIVILFVKPKWR